jgi:magnesium chelatase family protein
LLDRIDVRVEVPVLSPEVLAQAPDGEPSAVVAARVLAAREHQLARQGRLNAQLDGDGLDQHAQIDAAAMAMLKKASAHLGWSGRAFHRVIRLARTIADLAKAPNISVAHMGEAIQYRRVLVGG